MSDKKYLDYEGLDYVIKNIKSLIHSPSFFINLPVKTIAIWSGTEEEIPEGWHLCDGKEGTPDLRGKFILGSGSGYSIGEEGYTLTTDEDGEDLLSSEIEEDDSGLKNLLPPYYVLAYIMKLKDEDDKNITASDILFNPGPLNMKATDAQDAIKETYTFATSPASSIAESIGPVSEVSTSLAALNTKMRPITSIQYKQDGEGTPSIDNIRPITGYSSITLTHNEHPSTQEFSETVYSGTYDWTSGTLTITHKMFELYPSDMDRDEEYPGWNNVPGLDECIAKGTQITMTEYPTNIMHTARVSVKENGDNYIYVSTGQNDGGMTQSQWKERYGGQVCQFLLPLLEPKMIQFDPKEFVVTTAENVFSSDCGDTTVEFFVSIKKYLDKLLSES